MLAGRPAPDREAGNAGTTGDAWASRVEAARQSRGLTTGLAGTCVAIFTFLLFFLYPRLASGEADPNLFRLTVLAILSSLYLVVFAALCYFLCTQTLDVDVKRAKAYMAWGDRCFGVAVVFLVVEPALVLYTVNLSDLGSVALGFWVVFVVLYVFTASDLLRTWRRRAEGR